MYARKSLGQHFLMHARIAERIVRVAAIAPGATVLEVGPGTGILTRALLSTSCEKVVAVEADATLVEKLQTDFAGNISSGRLELAHCDIRDFMKNMGLRDPYMVVANIPYYLTGELFRMFLSAEHQPQSITFLVQKEVAERVATRFRSGQARQKESILSLSVKAYGTPKYEFTVPRGAFRPAPNVDSAVLTISDISRKNFSSRAAEKRFFDLLHAGFAHKRKRLRRNLLDAGLIAESDTRIPEKTRAEDLPLVVWLELKEQNLPLV